MKKIMSLMLGLSLALGTATVAFSQEKGKDDKDKKEASKKGKKKADKKDDKKKEDKK